MALEGQLGRLLQLFLRDLDDLLVGQGRLLLALFQLGLLDLLGELNGGLRFPNRPSDAQSSSAEAAAVFDEGRLDAVGRREVDVPEALPDARRRISNESNAVDLEEKLTLIL